MVNFIHPCPGSRVTSKFGWRESPTQKGVYEGHQGIDYAKSGVVPILASADGTVRQYTGDHTTYGNVLFIEHNIGGKRMDTTYAHLKSKVVKNGQKVKQGDIIGYMGNTGRSTGQHLHFEIHNGPWLPKQPNAVNPALYVDKESEEDKMNKELQEKVRRLELDIEALKINYKEEKEARLKDDVAHWAKEGREFVVKNGISDGTRPNAHVTRQEVWKMLHSLYKLIKGAK